MADLIFKITLSYLLGSLLGSLVIGKLRGVDIRTQGSGNAGGTNALRTQGWKFALGVMVIDIGKGWLAAAAIPELQLLGFASTTSLVWTRIACAIAVVIGHIYPVFFGFRGGKGAATLVGVVAGLTPAALGWVMGGWLVVLMLTGFVGLSTMLATVAFNVWVWLSRPEYAQALRVFGMLMLVLVVYTHRSNIQRMRAGTENRARTLWLFKPKS